MTAAVAHGENRYLSDGVMEILYWVVSIVVFLVVLGLLVGLVAPLFDGGPYRPFYWRRSLRSRRDLRVSQMFKTISNL